jgi:pimeloyl-ACP methyl ester carboxylesterase
MPLKQWERVCGLLGAVLIAAGLLCGRPAPDSRREITIHTTPSRPGERACHAPATVLRARTPIGPLGAAVLLHGLAANRRIMTMLGESLAAAGFLVYLIDLPGHGDNTDPFSFSRAEECSGAVVELLLQRGEITLDRTVLVGHSLGGDIAIRLADRFTARATIAISPGPLLPVPGVPAHLHVYDMPKQTPDTLLIFSGGFDVPGFAYGAKEMLARFGGEIAPAHDGFHPRQLVTIPATHTSLVFDERVRSMSAAWAQNAMEPYLIPLEGGSPGPLDRFLDVALPLGVVLLFPGLASHLTLLSRFIVGTCAESNERMGFGRVALIWAGGAVAGTAFVAAWDPLRFLRLYTGSYLASLALVFGAIAIAGSRLGRFPGPLGSVGLAPRVPPPSGNLEAYAWRRLIRIVAVWLLFGGAMAFYLVLAFGWAFSLSLGDLWMNSVRWWRFLILIPCVLPYSFAEELVVGAPSRYWRHERNEHGAAMGWQDHEPAWTRWWAGAQRLLRWITLRFLLWAPMVAALFLVRSDHVLAAVMAPAFLAVSLGQRLGADVIRRRAGSLVPGAIFSAILAAWFIAAVFPLT